MRFIVICATFLTVNISFARNFYYHTIRGHMQDVYKVMASEVEKQMGYKSVAIESFNFGLDEVMPQFKRGDILYCDLESIHSKTGLDQKAIQLLDIAHEKNVDIYMQFHKTSDEVFPKVVTDVYDLLERNKIVPVFTIKDQFDFVNKNYPHLRSTLVQNPESLVIKNVNGLAFSKKIADLGLEESNGLKKILFVEQCCDEGAVALRNFIETIQQNKMIASNSQIVVAVHPMSTSHYGDLAKLEDINISIFKSGPELKTIELFPRIDAVITVASTLKEIAKDNSIPTFAPQRINPVEFSYAGLFKFIEDLKPGDRARRNQQISDFTKAAASSWINLFRLSDCIELLKLFGPYM